MCRLPVQGAIVKKWKKKYFFVNVDVAFPAVSDMAKFGESKVWIAPRSTSVPDRNLIPNAIHI